MEFIKEWNEFDPGLDKVVKDYVDINKYNLPDLWDKELSEDDNIQAMIKYFNEFPDEMNTVLNADKIRKASRSKTNSLSGHAPIFQNMVVFMISNLLVNHFEQCHLLSSS